MNILTQLVIEVAKEQGQKKHNFCTNLYAFHLVQERLQA